MRRVTIGAVLFDQAKGAAVVTLVEEAGERVLPIFIGLWEGTAIFREIHRAPSQRPVLHDLFYNVLLGLQTRLEKIVVDTLSDNTYYAQLHFKQDDTCLIADARPSDAIALALRFQAPMYVAQQVFDTANKQEEFTATQEAESLSTTSDDVQTWLENIRPEDFADPQ